MAHGRAADRGRRGDGRLDRVRDRGGPRQRAPAAARRQGVDAAHRAGRAEGPRGAERPEPAAGRRARRRSWPADVAREPRGRGRAAGIRDAAGGRDHRRRAGRHRARRPPAPARRADDHRGAQRAPGRLLAQALQVALPARPGLVRPPAVPQVPRQLAGVLAEGQDRRLARDVHARHGAQLLELHHREERAVRRRRRRVDGGRRARRRRDHAAAEAAGAGDGHVGEDERARHPRHGRLRGRPAPLVRRTRGPTPTGARRRSSSAPTTPRTTSARRCGRPAPT